MVVQGKPAILTALSGALPVSPPLTEILAVSCDAVTLEQTDVALSRSGKGRKPVPGRPVPLAESEGGEYTSTWTPQSSESALIFTGRKGQGRIAVQIYFGSVFFRSSLIPRRSPRVERVARSRNS